MQDFRPLVIKPSAQNYHWGKVGEQSLVARLLGAFDPKAPYAELWFGTHQKAGCKVLTEKGLKSLHHYIEGEPEKILGANVVGQFGVGLPFLTKILSIEKALSIQTHPTKEQAATLRARDSSNYPDSNHKPEIAIAITEVEMLHGWADREEVKTIVADFPDLTSYLDRSGVRLESWDDEQCKSAARVLLSTPPAEIEQLNNRSAERLRQNPSQSSKSDLYFSLLKQSEISDPGSLLALLMRVLKLTPGQSIFTPNGEVHAYIRGELFECMANSDNVIRAGLTPKFKDVDALLSYANFGPGQMSASFSQADPTCPPFRKHDSSAAEFQVFSVPTCQTHFKYHKARGSPELLLLTQGIAIFDVGGHVAEIAAGDAIVIPAPAVEVSVELQDANLFRVTVPA